MSKKIFTYGIILMIMFFGSCDSKITEEPDDSNDWDLKLSEEVELQIRQDYLKDHVLPRFPQATIEDVWVEKYYGTYLLSSGVNPFVVVMMNSKHNEYENESSKINIGDKLFNFENENRILVWHEGNIYQLEGGSSTYMSRIFNYHLGLDMELEKCLIESVFGDTTPSDYGLYDVFYGNSIEAWRYHISYYGTYRGCVVITNDLRQPGGLVPTELDCIAGVIFIIEPSLEYPIISVWKEEDGSFYSLPMAYKQGLLTQEDIVNIAHIRSMHSGREIINLFENGNRYVYDFATGDKILSFENYDINNFRNYVE